MAKTKKAKYSPFLLKNFLIMFIAIGTLVGLAFYVGMMTRPQAAPYNWPQQVAVQSRQVLNKIQSNGLVTSAWYCNKGSNTYVIVHNTSIKPNEYLATKYVSNIKRAQSYAYSVISTANLVNQYCRY